LAKALPVLSTLDRLLMEGSFRELHKVLLQMQLSQSALERLQEKEERLQESTSIFKVESATITQFLLQKVLE
jgi:hypothetical protein